MDEQEQAAQMIKTFIAAAVIALFLAMVMVGGVALVIAYQERGGK